MNLYGEKDIDDEEKLDEICSEETEEFLRKHREKDNVSLQELREQFVGQDEVLNFVLAHSSPKLQEQIEKEEKEKKEAESKEKPKTFLRKIKDLIGRNKNKNKDSGSNDEKE